MAQRKPMAAPERKKSSPAVLKRGERLRIYP
jgi:hypothetical protein